MTYVATVTLPEATARRLADALGEDEALGNPAVSAIELTGDAWEVTAYFEEPPARRALKAALAAHAGPDAPDFLIDVLPDEDWVRKSLEGLPTVRAGRFVIHGAHRRGAFPANLIGIEIEAGLAFGTGHHGTTSGCLIALDRLARARRFRNILDLGAGSGVLAIAAARLWRAPVLATDIDPVATETAAENVRLNRAGKHVTTVTADGFRHPAIQRGAPYDLIIANILAGPLIGLAPSLIRHLAPGGTVVLSGLLAWQRGRVLAAYRDQGARLVRADRHGEWMTLTLAK